MKRLLIICLSVLFLASCSTYDLPPFASEGRWELQGNAVVNRTDNMMIDFGGGNVFPMSNASDASYDLHFVVNREQFNSYDPAVAEYLKDVLKAIPLRIDSVELILADQYMVLSTSLFNYWKPDYIRRADGSQHVVEANPVTSEIQPHDELWRNLLFDSKKRQIVVVDRLIKNGKHYAIVYIMQSEKKGIPFATPFHYNILDRHNIQPVGGHLEHLLGISINALNSSVR